jgi:hypothetical protein
MKSVYIYALVDPRDNHVRYVGKANKPEDRYKNHFNSSRDKNTHKRNWISSVRKDGFRPELLILDEVSIDNWQYWESFYISLYKTFGFNLVNYTSGGDGATFGNDGSWKKGNIPHNKGIPCKEETKEKIRNKLVGTSNVFSYKAIIQYDIQYNEIKRYKCIKDAIDESDGLFIASKISMCCKGIRKQHRGFIWKYDNGEKLVVEKIILGKKKVVQYDLNLLELNRFNSIADAYRMTNVRAGSIVRCCKGKDITAGGFIWKYDGDNIIKKINLQKRPVIQYDKGLIELNIFESITDASNKTGISIKNIWGCCNGKSKTSGGFIWKYKTN